MQPPTPEELQSETASRPRAKGPHTPVTYAIVSANVLVFLGQTALPGPARHVDGLAEHFALFAPDIWQGQVWRLLTAAFIHFGFAHIFLNMYVLWSVGRLCEMVLGPLRYTLVYLGSALGGTVASTVVTESIHHPITRAIPAGGASGALFGVAGALLTLVLLDREHRVFAARSQLRGMLLRFLGINVVIQFLIPNIDIAAHMGGAVFGAVIAAFLFGRSRAAGLLGPRIRRMSALALGVCVALTAWSIHPVGLPRFERWQDSPAQLMEDLLR